MKTTELLQPNETWSERNIASPFRESLISNVYHPLANVANFCAKGVGAKDILPKLDLASTKLTDSPRDPLEYSTRLLTRGLVAATTYAICGKVTGGLLRASAGASIVDGGLAKVLASESTGMIVGAAAHDFCLDAKNGKERVANVLSGVATFSVFEGLNKFSPAAGSMLTRLALQPAIGIAGGTTGYLAHEVFSGKQIDAAALGQAAMDGAALNVLMPAAKWSVSKLLTVSSAPPKNIEKPKAASDVIEIKAETRGAMQNISITGMHPARRNWKIFEALSATYKTPDGIESPAPPCLESLPLTSPKGTLSQAALAGLAGIAGLEKGPQNSNKQPSELKAHDWKETPIPLSPDTLKAVQNRSIQRMPVEQRKFATKAALEATLPTAIQQHGDMPPDKFSHAHGSIAEFLNPKEINTAISLYEARKLENIPHYLYLETIGSVAEKTALHPTSVHEAMVNSAIETGLRLGRISPKANVEAISSLTALQEIIVPAAAETKSQAMQVIMQSTNHKLENFQKTSISHNNHGQ